MCVNCIHSLLHFIYFYAFRILERNPFRTESLTASAFLICHSRAKDYTKLITSSNTFFYHDLITAYCYHWNHPDNKFCINNTCNQDNIACYITRLGNYHPIRVGLQKFWIILYVLPTAPHHVRRRRRRCFAPHTFNANDFFFHIFSKSLNTSNPRDPRWQPPCGGWQHRKK